MIFMKFGRVDAIEGDRDATLIGIVASIIPTWRKFKLLS